MFKLVIKRSKWMRGHNGWLRARGGKMCIFGFVGEAYGVPGLTGKISPIQIDSDKWPPFVMDQDTRIKILTINDSKKISDKRREINLKKIFKQNGIELLFE